MDTAESQWKKKKTAPRNDRRKKAINLGENVDCPIWLKCVTIKKKEKNGATYGAFSFAN